MNVFVRTFLQNKKIIHLNLTCCIPVKILNTASSCICAIDVYIYNIKPDILQGIIVLDWSNIPCMHSSLTHPIQYMCDKSSFLGFSLISKWKF